MIKDAKQNGVEEFWFLGDLFMPGPGTSDLLDLLVSSNTTTFVKGNWDGCFTSVIEEYDTINYDNPEEIFIFTLVKYVFENLSDDQIQFMFNLPMTIEKEIYGVKFHLSHNLPNKFNGGDLVVERPSKNFAKIFENTDAKIAIYGHIHEPVLRQIGIGDERKIINPGAVSTTQGKDSNYAILKVEESGTWSVEYRHIVHDYSEVLSESQSKKLPYYDLYEDTMLTHVIHTHNAEGINENNIKYKYANELKDWLNDENNKIKFEQYRK
ncbi:metallophosphoesterase family protein [Macrococcus animalis]|uniref:metallophosphoesterase family protein n=1 Tax=Macrococcus animalis TaxID=3395467 RepID=UPI0039BECE44